MRATTASLTFTGIATIALALTPASITAQARGSHGGGGGFHGGGSHASAPSGGGRSFGGGSYRAAPTPPSHAAPRSYAREESNRPSGFARTPQSGYAGGRTPNSSAPAASDGFVTADGTAPAHPSTPQANFVTRLPRVENTDVRVRTFVGQGNELVEELPRAVAAPAVPPATSQTIITPKRPAPGSQMFGSAPSVFNQRAPFANFGLGYGFERGIGWGSCWGAAWALDPACLYSFGPVYGLYGSPDYDYDSSVYPAAPDTGYDQNNQPAEVPAEAAPETPAPPVNPNWDSTINAPSAGAGTSGVVIYFRNGTEIKPSDYWFSGDKLHYIAGGQETAVDIESVDLQRTNSENQKNGVQFWLKSGPDQIPGLTAPQATPQSAPGAPPSDSVPHPSFVPQSSVLTPTA